MTDDYYEDWCNETLSWRTSRGPDGKTVTGTRKSLGVASREMYDQGRRIADELALSGAATSSCVKCEGSTQYRIKHVKYLGKNMWKCYRCGTEWDSLKLKYRGM